MKKVVVLMSFAVVALFAACKSSEAQAPVATDSVAVEEAVVVDTTIVADSAAVDTTVAAAAVVAE